MEKEMKKETKCQCHKDHKKEEQHKCNCGCKPDKCCCNDK